MTSSDPTPQTLNQARLLAAEARQALAQGERRTARFLAARAAAADPGLEDAWLILAAAATPRAALVYLERALELNPDSQRAQAGMVWAQTRWEQAQTRTDRSALAGAENELREGESAAERGEPAKPPPGWYATEPREAAAASPTRSRKRRGWATAGLLAACAAAALALWAWTPVSGPWLGRAEQAVAALVFTETPTATATAAATWTATATATATDTPTPTETPTQTPTETATATPTQTATLPPTNTNTPLPSETATPEPIVVVLPPEPTRKPKPQKIAGPEGRPEQVGSDERWIDVDLSSQTTHAMVGDQILNSFLVSTGAWPTVTITGVYRIYVKYEAADMYGADYYLSGVPFVMYFYKGYGLHGTFWHNNFGTPMSHGCVNLRPSEAEWLFEFARIGTVVSIHP